ncbi:aminopeptidase N [Streptomyces scabiei]|uniref:aminopeptidase N n=1 Tax=Streptomyces scabiei TaxID=1930 RepID=UPI0004E670BF|nr:MULTISPECIES: aminopeptidase N [Streptomyces]KFG05143.1 aminopeptidase N [Streptomyces scabiei]MBP5894335.1 aminopeptidase N [Streptomyces sp. LBUM 1481]MBP5924598.1 aminopeptidase N [Streptomyces sp. LBUM 1483]MDX2691012.1 aminopeptidase N [Streptomyces scabiei]MDX2756162.1 aminopeptidase N [Streptomyces scabiei]
MSLMSVLTRDEAQARARLLDVHRYEIALDLTRGDETFDSRTVIHFTVRGKKKAADTFVELKPAELRSVTLDGEPLDPGTLDGNRLTLKGLTPGDHELRVDAAMRYSRTGEGMHRFTDPTDNETYVYTQLFMDDVQRVFAAFDQPDLKAAFDLTVTAPDGWTVLANGITERQDDGTWQAATTPPISTYLVAVAAGPWHSVRTEHRGLPFGIHCRRSLAPHLDTDADELLDITRALFDRYHAKFEEPYPFDSYDQAFVPEFNAGAMENPGLVTFRDEFVYRSAVTDTERQTRAMVIAHEMAHMWFGDLVTLRWWDDIWLNESFAEYMGYQTLTEASRFTNTWVDFGVARKAWGYDADQRPSTHPVAPENVDDTAAALLNFDGISYAKGASALRQLVAWLGEKDFLAGINAHFTRHRFGNATLADFIDNLAGATERDVHAWADAWLRTTGVDTLTPKITRAADGTHTLTVDRTGSRPHHITVGVYDRDPGDDHGHLTLRDRVELDLPQAAEQPIGKRPALLLLNDGDLTYAKIRFDTESAAAVTAHLSGLPDPLTRAVVWNALRDAVRDAELPAAAYLEAARTHLPHESDLAIVQGVLSFATTQVADRYLTPEQRPAGLATLGSLCRDLIRRTEDGDNPGLRLTAVRHFIDVAAHPETIAAWLADGTVPGGPELDPELRWRVLGRLAVLGAVDTATVDEELERDPSASGREGAARCRAALPEPEAKQAAWEAMFTTDDLSNYLFTATAQGFWQPEQAALLTEYVERYWADAVTLAARRGPAIAEAAGRWAFPVYAVDPETLGLGERCLQDDELIPALRRKLVDQLDDLARALRVREA